jgi:glycosyltransferase involved in cell wall biosynthesis
MHVLMSVNAAWNIWNFRRPLVSALIADGHRVTVLAPHDSSVADLEKLDCRFIPLKISAKGLNPAEGLQLLRQFKRVFKAERPDVVLSYTIKNNIFGAMAARSRNIPFVPNVTGLGTAFLSGGLLLLIAKALYRHAFKYPPVVFFQNEDDRDLFLDNKLVKAQQARLLPGSGIDLERFAVAEYPEQSEAPVFLMIARLLLDKGVLEYVEAARQVQKQVPGARFQLLGATDSENRTAIDRDTVSAWEAEELVEYLGTTSDVRPHIAAAHCVVLPSYREGAPRTLIEAAAMARPLITTDVPGCRAVVTQGMSGFLCQVKSGESLARACLKFLAMPHTEQVEMGEAGRAKMEEEFDDAIVVGAYRTAIDELTGHLMQDTLEVRRELPVGDAENYEGVGR